VSAHWTVELADGRSVFVKQPLTSDARRSLQTEISLYDHLRGRPFVPECLGAHHASALLVLEDLSGAEWPPPWSARRVASVLSTLETVHGTPAPPAIARLEDRRESVVGWDAVAEDPEPLLATGLCSRTWLVKVLAELVRTSAGARLDGNDLLHLDVRSDNLCFAGDRTVLVDWNLACVGNGEFDVAFWLPSLSLEGGPEPWEVMNGTPLSAVVAGFFASRAGLPPPVEAPTVRAFQRAQAEVALRWAARDLGLPPVDGRWRHT
jgi:aminoglycoside phosphotransferase (APT) family kinase protein